MLFAARWPKGITKEERGMNGFKIYISDVEDGFGTQVSVESPSGDIVTIDCVVDQRDGEHQFHIFHVDGESKMCQDVAIIHCFDGE